MRRKIINSILLRSFKLLLVTSFISYWLQALDERFVWTLFISVVGLFWVCLAGVCSLLEYLIYRNIV